MLSLLVPAFLILSILPIQLLLHLLSVLSNILFGRVTVKVEFLADFLNSSIEVGCLLWGEYVELLEIPNYLDVVVENLLLDWNDFLLGFLLYLLSLFLLADIEHIVLFSLLLTLYQHCSLLSLLLPLASRQLNLNIFVICVASPLLSNGS